MAKLTLEEATEAQLMLPVKKECERGGRVCCCLFFVFCFCCLFSLFVFLTLVSRNINPKQGAGARNEWHKSQTTKKEKLHL